MPEKYPIALSTSMSETLVQYKKLFMLGLRILLEQSNQIVSQQVLLGLITDMPIFINCAFFELNVISPQEIRALFNDQSRAFHLSANSISSSLRYLKVESVRTKKCTVTSNRIRHTVLTRGAQNGLDATMLAKITGVTRRAVHNYIDLDYTSRLMIDDSYIGSDFLSNNFNAPLMKIPEDDECVSDQSFNPVGGLRDKANCATCSTAMGRPLGCYGCGNFRPILEADHGQVLGYAEMKLVANSKRLLSPEDKLSVEKIKKQIKRIKQTMSACERVLEARRGIK